MKTKGLEILYTSHIYIQGEFDIIYATKGGDRTAHLEHKTPYQICSISNHFRDIVDKRNA